MKSAQFVLSVDDVATKNFSDPRGFAELLEFLGAENVRANLFVVPFDEGIPLDKRKEWRAVLDRALAAGHSVQLHGYRHSPFEFGIPPDFILAYEDECRRKVEKERRAIEAELSESRIMAKLSRGVAIFEKTFGFRPMGFRSPYLSIHRNLFKVLKNCGFEWDSSLAINPKGWHYIRKDYKTETGWITDIEPEIFRHPAGILEVPLMTEYTWFLTEEDIERQFGLIREDMEAVEKRGGILISLSHVGSMTGKYKAGLAVYKKVFAYARRHAFTIATIEDAVKEFNANCPPAQSAVRERVAPLHS